ncbi:MAG TPA: BamA/TamA family outer membrane protein [Chitinispirillaceae bacterium]|nr:BamA/TamA family outer membrane protein [Chitinispirillaceae bacterium]
MQKFKKQSILYMIIGVILIAAIPTSAAREKKWKVREITFTGNKSFKKKNLLQVMELKPSNILSSTVFTEYKLGSDLSTLESFYRSQGFLDIKVGRERVTRDSLKRKVNITIAVTEGERYFIKSVSMRNNSNVVDSSYVKSLDTKPFKPLNGVSLDQDVEKLREKVMKKGHLKADVFYTLDIDSVRHTAGVMYTIIEGPRIYADNIIVKGNKGLKDRVIERELDFKKEELLTINSIRKTEQRLYRTNLVNYVKVEPVLPDSLSKIKNTADTTVPVMVTVGEVDFLRVEAGAGYGTADKFRGSLTTSYGNLFQLGHKATISGNLSKIVQEVELRYGVPWFLLVPLKVDAAGYITNRTDIVRTYNALTKGFELSFGQHTDISFAYQLRFKWEDVSRISDSTKPKNNIQSVGLDLAWDTRNDLLNPVKGFYNLMKFEVAGLTGNRSEEFVKVTTDHRVYWKTGKLKWASALELGWGIPYGKTSVIPTQERFYGGGSQSVRGYREDAIRKYSDLTNASGNISLVAHVAEVKMPLFWWVEAAMFLDGGYIWIRDTDTPDKLNFQSVIRDLRWSAGPGIRINTPIAVLRLDAGFKLQKSRHENLVVIHFDIGNAF